jgi:hypothetical protein
MGLEMYIRLERGMPSCRIQDWLTAQRLNSIKDIIYGLKLGRESLVLVRIGERLERCGC